jgi:hypothetical protein
MVRKMVLTAALMLLALPALASAQAGSVAVTATVDNVAVVTGSGDLAFGTLDPVNGNSVDAAGGVAAALRTLTYNHDVTVTFVAPAVLTSGSNSLNVSLMCAARIGLGAWSTPEACSTASLELDVAGAITEATLGFGGSIAAGDIALAVAGAYTATIDIYVAAR